MLDFITWALAAYGTYCAITQLMTKIISKPKPAPAAAPQVISAPTGCPKVGDMRISHVEGHGYIPEIFLEFYDWQVIDREAASEASRSTAISYPHRYFHETEAEAGDTLNRYHRHHLGENTTVWHSRQAA